MKMIDNSAELGISGMHGVEHFQGMATLRVVDKTEVKSQATGSAIAKKYSTDPLLSKPVSKVPVIP